MGRDSQQSESSPGPVPEELTQQRWAIVAQDVGLVPLAAAAPSERGETQANRRQLKSFGE